jgi:hypothetical protein
MAHTDNTYNVYKPHEEFAYFMRGRKVVILQLDRDSSSSTHGQYIPPFGWKDSIYDNDDALTGDIGLEEGLQFEYSFVQDLSTITQGQSDIEISDFLIQAVVDYIKGQLIEDHAQFQIREYYMKRFRDRVSQFAGSRMGGPRVVKPSRHGIV